MSTSNISGLLLLLFFLAFGVSHPDAAPAQPSGGALTDERFRVIVSTDIGGSDPDDFQSIVYNLMYADRCGTAIAAAAQ